MNVLNAQILAVAAVGVGVEVADKCALDSSACAGKERELEAGYASRVGHCEGQFANGARLGEANGGPGRIAYGMDGDFGLLAEADDEEPFRCETRRGVEQQCVIRASLVFAAGEYGRGG